MSTVDRLEELERIHDDEMFRWLKRYRKGESVEDIVKSYGFQEDDWEFEPAFDLILYAIEDADW